MKTQGKNQVLSILGEKKPKETMMCSFRCDKTLWADFEIYCKFIEEKDKTTVLIDYIQECVDSEKGRIELAKQLRG